MFRNLNNVEVVSGLKIQDVQFGTLKSKKAENAGGVRLVLNWNRNEGHKKMIEYTKGYKYQLRKQAIFKTKIMPDKDIHAPLVSLYRSGLLAIEKYFAWDGCSGPTLDDHTNMRAGLCHDALYYLMRSGRLDIKWRSIADQMLYDLMICDGAPRWRATYYRWAVNKFAKSCALPKNAKKVIICTIGGFNDGRNN